MMYSHYTLVPASAEVVAQYPLSIPKSDITLQDVKKNDIQAPFVTIVLYCSVGDDSPFAS